MTCARCSEECSYPHVVPMPNGEVWEICDKCYGEVSTDEEN